MARIKPIQAMNYLSLSRDSFDAWCDAVNIQSYKYEFSNRTYFISGQFYALADKVEIKKIKAMYGEKWSMYYSKSVDVLPFIRDDEPNKQQLTSMEYKPKSTDVANFIKGLKG
jgi:hypothetical protein